MANLDRYGGAQAWDAYVERQCGYNSILAHHGFCGDCDDCEKPDPHEFPNCSIAWCKRLECFIDPNDHPAEYSCDEPNINIEIMFD